MNEENFRVAVVGLGYVGLPLAVHIAERGIPVQGFDIDPAKIASLSSGSSPIPDAAPERIREAVRSGRLTFSAPSADIRNATHVIVTVPTPLTRRDQPDLRALKSATWFIGHHLAAGQTVIYESTTFPGTLEEVVIPLLNRSGLKAGRDFFAGYSPERIDPGNASYRLHQIPKVVSGFTPECLERVQALYGRLFDRVVPVSSPKVAEMCKLFENIQRLVNISLVNEMDSVCERMGIDFREALEAAATKPFGFTPYWPGPGIGGHCIPVDPLYFQWRAKQYGLSSKLIQAAHQINRKMPLATAAKILGALPKDRTPCPRHPRVLLVGVAYKKDVGDVRESPALETMRKLLGSGCEVDYHDPRVPELHLDGASFRSADIGGDRLAEYDVVAIITDHTGLPWDRIRERSRALVDTRGVIRAMGKESTA
ncbi:nucleotide sugar dehydrogenase [Cohnella caldifontis]|uniref:nucleotide sugar dehydrogenase n=1 Tax=Cohnella caldifontis TaxID=3027471 RepID=UPI0023EBB0A6|nr:nucleotide sugar dehydrogenase [Cohnella sp. YIM B05605]